MWDRFMNWLGQLLGPKVISDSETLKGVRLLTSSGEYGKILSTAKLNDSTKKSVLRACDSIYANKARYRKVEDLTGCPWHVVGVIHLLESSLNFKGVLHNGEKIIGTGRKTRLVPAGRGPFYSWETAAVDALKARVADLKPDWDIEQTLGFLEQYNGLGYRRRGILSPYLWSFTNKYTRGKFVADGKFDPYAVSKQVGACAVFLGFVEKGVHLEGLTEVADVENPETRPGAPPQYWKPGPFHPMFNVPAPYTHLHPIDILRSVAGEKEILGSKDNPLIAHFHEHSGNLGTHSEGADYHDEVPHCASAQNWAQDGAGCEKSNNALASSYQGYAKKFGSRAYRKGDKIPEGAIITIPGHVTRANKSFIWTGQGTFEGFGSNQGNTIKTSLYAQAKIITACDDMPKRGTALAPVGILGHKPVPSSGGENESTR
jgi:lysozyme family protein